MKVKCYNDLEVWKKGMDLVEEIDLMTERFPRRETFGLAAQLRKSAVSIPSNIAEGSMRGSTKEFIHFVSIALGSSGEPRTQIEIAQRLKFIDRLEYSRSSELSDRLGKQLQALRKTRRKKLPSKSK